jgi:hypothetical protein
MLENRSIGMSGMQLSFRDSRSIRIGSGFLPSRRSKTRRLVLQSRLEPCLIWKTNHRFIGCFCPKRGYYFQLPGRGVDAYRQRRLFYLRMEFPIYILDYDASKRIYTVPTSTRERISTPATQRLVLSPRRTHSQNNHSPIPRQIWDFGDFTRWFGGSERLYKYVPYISRAHLS